jgi:glutamate formiminotransferase
VTIIEAVPNVSEGRCERVIQALVDAVTNVPGAYLLDCSSDPSHNRSVLTLVGDGTGLTNAILRLFAIAIKEIDLRTHRGEHPRIGAVDVVPFIPIQEATTAECMELARNLGFAVADRFGVPVYLYEDAAILADRSALEEIRRGQFEGLVDKMQTAGWSPDFGGPLPHLTAGATALGARGPLIAFNINLRTEDVEVAQQISRLVRARSGGLPAVKAIGVSLNHRGLVQVSVNLTDFKQTPLHRVFNLVQREADKLGVEVENSEIVGLVPEDALMATAAQSLRLNGFTPRQVLEARLRHSLTLPSSCPALPTLQKPDGEP